MTKPKKGDARQALIDAARKIFAEQGYSGATTRAIAREAGTSEMALFRCFQSKSNLFKEAVFQPFDLYLKTFVEQEFPEQPPTTLSAVWRRFSGELFTLLEENSALLSALVDACKHDAGEILGMQDLTSLDLYFDHAAEAVARTSHYPDYPPEIVARLVFGLISSVVLFRRWLFPDHVAPIEEVIKVMQHFGANAFSLPEREAAARAQQETEQAAKPGLSG